jgi:hypothetical protein
VVVNGYARKSWIQSVSRLLHAFGVVFFSYSIARSDPVPIREKKLDILDEIDMQVRPTFVTEIGDLLGFGLRCVAHTSAMLPITTFFAFDPELSRLIVFPCSHSLNTLTDMDQC